jgi:hypothetical protein
MYNREYYLIDKQKNTNTNAAYGLFHCLGFKFGNSLSLTAYFRYVAMFTLVFPKGLGKDERAYYYNHYQQIKNVKDLFLAIMQAPCLSDLPM